MKKLLTILILLLAVASQSWADYPEIVIWEGNEPISWNTEVYQGSQYELTPAIDLKKDDIIKIATTKGLDSPQYVLTYKKGGNWDWTDLIDTNTTDNNIMSYTVESDEIATEIKRGLIFRGQGYNITKVSVIRPLNAESGATVDGNKINVDNFKITSAAALKAVQLWLNENDNVKGDMLTIKLASTSSVELNVFYYGTDTQGPSIYLIPGSTPAEVNLPLDGNKTINKIEIKSSAANQEITLSEISIASAKEVFKPNGTLTLVASTGTKGQSVSYYKFGNASSGDKILVFVTGTESSVSMDMKAGGDNPLRGHAWNSDINQSVTISESFSTQRVFVYELTEGNRLNYIKDHGFYIEVTSGSCTLDKIMLVSAGDIPISEPNIFDGDGKADISRASTDGEGTYEFSSTGLNIAAPAGKGITLNTVTGETVNRKELAISLDKAIPVTVQYTIGGESKTAILNAKDINLTLDENKALTQVSIKPVNATTGDGSVTVKNVAVLSTSSASTASNKDELWAGSRAITAEYGIPFNYKYDRLAAGDVIRVTYSGDGDLNAAISYSTDGSAKTSISSLIADLEAKTLEFAVTSDMLEPIKTYGLYVSGNLTLSKVERITASTIPAESALADGETIVLWKSQAGEAIDYSVLFTVGSALAGIIEKNEQILVSVSSIETGDGKYNKVWACSLSDTNTQLISEQHLGNAPGTLALTITADKLGSLRSGFGIAADDMTITEVSLRKPKLIDSFTGYTNAEAHTMTAKQWNGGITLDYGTGSDESAAYLTVETSEGSVLKHEITFTDGWVYEYYDSEATSSRTIALDATKKIQKIFLQNANSENASTEGTVTFSNIALSSTTSGSVVTPSTKKALTNTASITEVNTKAGRLVVNLTNALATTVKIGYDDETVALYPVNNTAKRNLALDATKTISTIDIVKADDSETALAISEIYLQMTSVEGDEAAITKPTTDANTTLFAPSAGVAMSGNKICLVSAVYVTNLLEAGQEMNVTLSKGENPVLKLLNESGEEVKSYNLKDLQGSVARIPVTATLLSSIANGFSLSGSDITISKVEIFKPATQTAPTTENSLTLYNNESPEMTGYADICYVNSGYGAVFEEDMELRITVTEISSGSSDYRKVLIHDANSTEQLGAGFAEVNAAGDVVFTLKAADVEAMKNGFCVLAQNIKVSKIVLAKTTKTEKTLKEMTEAVAIGDGDIKINRGLFANAVAGDIIRIYGTPGEGAKIALEPSDYSGALEGANWAEFTTSPFELVLTDALLTTVKAKDLLIRGEKYTFTKAVLYSASAIGSTVYALKVTQPTAGGTIKLGETAAAASQDIAAGESVTLTASPAEGYHLDYWTKDDTNAGTESTLTFTMESDVTVTASFSNKSERVLKEESVAISEGDIKINRGLFANAVAGDIIRIYGTPGEGAKIALEPSDYSGALEGANWAEFTTSPFELVLTDALLTTVKAKDLLIRGESFTFKKAVLYTESELGNEIIDIKSYTLTIQTPQNGTITVKRGNEQVSGGSYDEGTVLTLTAIPNDDYQFVKWTKNGADAGTESTLTITMDSDVDIAAFFEEIPKPVIDEETGETDLSTMTAQDETTTVTYDEETETVTMTTTEPDKGVQIWFDTPEQVKGNVLLVDIAEANVTVSVTVRYTDGTQSSMTSTTAASQRTVARRAASNGTTIAVPVETGKQVQCIEVKNAEAGVIHITKMAVIEKNVFDENGKADLSMGKAQSNATYDISTYTLATTKGWTGLTITPLETEEVKGIELMVKFASKSQVKVAVTYSDDESIEKIMEEAAPYVKMTLDGNKNVKDIMIQTTTAAIIQLTEVAVNQTVTPDELPEPVFSNGKADLSRFEVQDANKVMYNAETYKMATTDGWVGVQMNTSEAESVSGAELAVSFTEAVKVKFSVTYKDGTQADTISAQAQQETRLLLDATKSIQQIQVQPTEAGALQFVELVVRQTPTPDPEPVYLFNEQGEADLTMFQAMDDNASYDTTTYQITTSQNWAGIQAWLENPQSVSGNMLSVKLIEESANIRVTIGYTDGTESAADGSKAIATETGTEILVPNDATKEIQKIMIQVVEKGSVTLQSITGIDYSVTELEEGETRLLWKNSQGVELHWNNICEQDAVYGALLKEDQQLCITIISRDEDNEWPKVFIRDINNQEVGEVVELNSLKQFPNVVRLTLTAEMVSRMADGFSICGDGITVNRVELYQPYAPQAGDINLKELNGGWNATYDAASHTITTTARWAARGWDIGDSRYNSYDLIQVKFLAVDFPVTLKMEYTDANGNKQATSTGVSAGNTTLQMPIPENIQQIDKVYLIWQQPASLTLTAAEVLSESDWNYPELMSVSTDIRYITHEGESEKWYDLNGRRVEQPSKGVFIKNGKKTVISK